MILGRLAKVYSLPLAEFAGSILSIPTHLSFVLVNQSFIHSYSFFFLFQFQITILRFPSLEPSFFLFPCLSVCLSLPHGFRSRSKSQRGLRRRPLRTRRGPSLSGHSSRTQQSRILRRPRPSQHQTQQLHWYTISPSLEKSLCFSNTLLPVLYKASGFACDGICVQLGHHG